LKSLAVGNFKYFTQASISILDFALNTTLALVIALVSVRALAFASVKLSSLRQASNSILFHASSFYLA